MRDAEFTVLTFRAVHFFPPPAAMILERDAVDCEGQGFYPIIPKSKNEKYHRASRKVNAAPLTVVQFSRNGARNPVPWF
jgi:hypothetical protein